MKQNLNMIWREIYGDESEYIYVEPAKIKKKVKRALDMEIHEKNVPLRRKVRMIPVHVMLLAMTVCLTAFAFYYKNTVIHYFKGDTVLIEQDVEVLDEVIEEEKYKILIDSMLSDSHNTILGLTIEALTDEANTELYSDGFNPKDILRFETENKVTSMVSVTYVPAPSNGDKGGRSFSFHLEGIGVPNTLYLYLEGASKEDAIALNLDKQIESLSVNAMQPLINDDYYIRSCVLNATGLELEVEFAEKVEGDKIIEFCFRMTNGDLRTLSQLSGKATPMNIWKIKEEIGNVYRYTASFHTLVDPLSVTGVLMNGMEYSFLDSEYVVAADIPENLQPFLTPFVKLDNAFYFYAYDVCEHIGASIDRNGEQYTIKYLDKEVLVEVGEKMIILNGVEMEQNYAAAYVADELVLSSDMFRILGLEYSMYFPKRGVAHDPENWLITP